MSYWWDTDFAQASQNLYDNPALAVDAATVPDFLKTQSQKEYIDNQQQAQEEAGGFMGMLGRVINKVDSIASNVPGWGVAKEAAYTPLEVTGKALYEVYSEVLSQPISTLMLQGAKADLNGIGTLFTADEWADAYHRAEHISPGQAITNSIATRTALGAGGSTFEQIIDPTGHFLYDGWNISDDDKKKIAENSEKYLYATDFWENRGGWKYTVGSGSIDFLLNVADPLTGAIISKPIEAIKTARSVQLAARPAELVAQTGAPRLARTRGTVVDLFVKQQEPEQIVQNKSLQKTFDWMKADGRTVEEIAAHPIWGKGRRVNPAKHDLSRLISQTPRDKMETLFRYAMEDPKAAKEIAETAPELQRKILTIQDNRALLEGADVDPIFAAYHLGVAEGKSIPIDPNLLVEPPTPRPTTPGPAQDGWDARWGDLHQKAEYHRDIANQLTQSKIVSISSDPLPLNRKGIIKAEKWMKGRIEALNDDYNDLMNQQRYLGDVLGRVDDWTPNSSPLYGGLNKLHRAGEIGLRDTELAASKAALKGARGRKPPVRGSNVAMTMIKNGMGAPMAFIHTFGDGVPQGFVNHHQNDAPDRVMDMLRQVEGMTPQQRIDLIEKYNKANGKFERSKALGEIHDSVLDHILINKHGMDDELAAALRDSIKSGISEKLLQLTKTQGVKHQAFGPQAVGQDEVARLTGVTEDEVAEGATMRADRVHAQENGVGYIISPLAQSQLAAGEVLLPIKEIQRIANRTAGHFKSERVRLGNAKDAVTGGLDYLDGLWKFTTLLRPGFIPRMVSDEVLARMFKFGAMATLLDTSQGIGHFFENRGRQLLAHAGYGSYTPGTGAGIKSKRAIVNLNPEDNAAIIAAAKARGDKVRRIRVPATLHMVHKQILKERDAMAKQEKDLAKLLRKQANGKDVTDDIADVRAMMDDHQHTIDEYNEYMAEILRKAQDSTGKRLGEDDFLYKVGDTTYRVPKAFSSQWNNPIPRDQISSSSAMQALWGRGQSIERERFLSHAMKTGGYTFVYPGDVNHMESWLNALNLQMRQDPFHRMIAGGATDEQALHWLLKEHAGRQYMLNMGIHNQDPEQFVRSVRFMMDKYAADPALRAKLANEEMITEQELRAAFDTSEFPIVHGEEIKELSALQRKQTMAHYIEEKQAAAWRALADIPTDIMSRNPVYLQIHQGHMEDLISRQYYHNMTTKGSDHISLKELDEMNALADKRARAQMRQIVYDPKHSMGADALRFIYPFFRPYVDGIQRWSGLIAERPEQLAKVGKVYNSPVAANLVTDNDGNSIDQTGYATVEEIGEDGKPHKVRKFIPLKDRVLHLKAPWAKKSEGDIRIRMQSLNTILPGDPWWDPGTGPIVQLGGNWLAKKSPQVGDFLKWAKIIPMGESDSVIDTIRPKYLKSAWDAYNAGDVDNVAYQKTFAEIYAMETAAYNEKLRQGLHADPPTMDEIAEKAQHFMNFKVLTDWISPASVKTDPLNGTKFQFFADQYKALQKVNPETASDEFLKRYGEDYIAFTTAMTKSLGIAPTLSADAKMEQYHDLIEQDPDMAAALIGSMYNGGEFSDAVYNKQFRTEIGGKMVREQLTAQEAIRNTRVREGWRDFMRQVTALDGELKRYGFNSYQQSGAEPFAEAKRKILAQISASNPAWAEEFGKTDRNKVQNRIATFTRMVQDQDIMSDPRRQDAQAMAVYLYRRQQFKAALQQRGLQQLSFDVHGYPTGEAADLGYAWREFQGQMTSQSVSFSYLFNRYLNADDLQ